MEEHGIGGIDLVSVNLYPFESTIAGGADYATAIENIDIGGPAMIRSAAKNHGYVAVCTEIADVEEVLAELQADGTTSLDLRKRLAARAYARTAAYDAAISGWFAQALGDEAPRRRAFAGELVQTMRYGENPHQKAAFELIAEFDPGKSSACAIIKHANPCGVATGGSLLEAYERALACDPTSAF